MFQVRLHDECLLHDAGCNIFDLGTANITRILAGTDEIFVSAGIGIVTPNFCGALDFVSLSAERRPSFQLWVLEDNGITQGYSAVIRGADKADGSNAIAAQVEEERVVCDVGVFYVEDFTL